MKTTIHTYSFDTRNPIEAAELLAAIDRDGFPGRYEVK